MGHKLLWKMFTTEGWKWPLYEVGNRGRVHLKSVYSDHSITITQPTCWRESQLPANHTGIKSIPCIITYGAPYIVDAQLNSTFINVWAASESHSMVSASNCSCEWAYYTNMNQISFSMHHNLSLALGEFIWIYVLELKFSIENHLNYQECIGLSY